MCCACGNIFVIDNAERCYSVVCYGQWGMLSACDNTFLWLTSQSSVTNSLVCYGQCGVRCACGNTFLGLLLQCGGTDSVVCVVSVVTHFCDWQCDITECGYKHSGMLQTVWYVFGRGDTFLTGVAEWCYKQCGMLQTVWYVIHCLVCYSVVCYILVCYEQCGMHCVWQHIPMTCITELCYKTLWYVKIVIISLVCYD